MLENWAFQLSRSEVVIATVVLNSVCDFVDAEAKERNLPNSWRGERVDEVVQRFHHRLSGKVDRHARDDGEGMKDIREDLVIYTMSSSTTTSLRGR